MIAPPFATSCILLLGTVFLSSTIAFLPSIVGNTRNHHSVMASEQLEIKLKFPLTDEKAIRNKLESLGFWNSGTVEFSDWYFDNEDCALSKNDNWLRYRKTPKGGQWELKQGIKEGKGNTTVYREIAGVDAINMAVSLVPDGSPVDSRQGVVQPPDLHGFDLSALPHQARAKGILPFCRIDTTRSKWTVGSHPDRANDSFRNLSVDLDWTNTGHVVGEVEAVVDGTSDIREAQEKVESLCTALGMDKNVSGPAIGKLEHYLMTYRPEHYAICLAHGSMKEEK